MSHSFTITRAEVHDSDEATLLARLREATGSEVGAASLMRSLERMGSDESIDYFEMTEVTGTQRYGGAAVSSWRVRADRGIVAEAEEIAAE